MSKPKTASEGQQKKSSQQSNQTKNEPTGTRKRETDEMEWKIFEVSSNNVIIPPVIQSLNRPRSPDESASFPVQAIFHPQFTGALRYY